jgi:serine phosphatase RsbU (regulator of sigma subunit)
VVVGDVTGKSLPAALVMALARNTIRSELVNNPHPAEAMTTANRWLCTDIRRGTFVATIQALLVPLEQKMWLVNAGQMAALLAREGQVQYLLPDEAIGFPLGIQPQQTYTQVGFPLLARDTYLFYTDGIVEAKSPTGEMFGFERLMSGFQRLHQLQNPAEIIERLLAEMQAFVGEAEQHDDITLVVVQVADQ